MKKAAILVFLIMLLIPSYALQPTQTPIKHNCIAFSRFPDSSYFQACNTAKAICPIFVWPAFRCPQGKLIDQGLDKNGCPKPPLCRTPVQESEAVCGDKTCQCFTSGARYCEGRDNNAVPRCGKDCPYQPAMEYTADNQKCLDTDANRVSSSGAIICYDAVLRNGVTGWGSSSQGGADTCVGNALTELHADCSTGPATKFAGNNQCLPGTDIDIISEQITCPQGFACANSACRITNPSCPLFDWPTNRDCPDASIVEQGIDSNGCPKPPLCLKNTPTCHDSDSGEVEWSGHYYNAYYHAGSGKAYTQKGTVSLNNKNVFTDTCKDQNTLTEGFCEYNYDSQGHNRLQTQEKICPRGCKDGACIAAACTQNSIIGDLDGDGFVRDVDYRILKSIVMTNKPVQISDNTCCADINQDGILTWMGTSTRPSDLSELYDIVQGKKPLKGTCSNPILQQEQLSIQPSPQPQAQIQPAPTPPQPSPATATSPQPNLQPSQPTTAQTNPNLQTTVIGPRMTCTDTDSGNNIQTRGILTLTPTTALSSIFRRTVSRGDFCTSGRLIEYYCKPDARIGFQIITCPQGKSCQLGACI